MSSADLNITGSANLQDLTDEELIKRFCASPPDREACEELSRRCLPRLQKTIRFMVYAKSTICPPWYDRGVFIEDAMDEAKENYVRNICGFRFEGSVYGWLLKLAKRAAFDVRRKLVGRGSAPRVMESIETLDAEVSVVGAQLLFRSIYWTSPYEFVRDLQRQEIVERLLIMHGEKSLHGLESASVIKWRLVEECTFKEIARVRGDTSADRVYQMASRDYRALHRLLTEEFGITKLDDI